MKTAQLKTYLEQGLIGSIQIVELDPMIWNLYAEPHSGPVFRVERSFPSCHSALRFIIPLLDKPVLSTLKPEFKKIPLVSIFKNFRTGEIYETDE